MNFSLTDNWILTAIALLALTVYFRIFKTLFIRSDNKESADNSHLPAMVSALPLLGLLGTIAGLLQTFQEMSLGESLEHSNLLSSGISDALATTQFGLATAIPAWLLIHLMKSMQITAPEGVEK
ncbi:MotA/TolQ/ExbB proton channel family protein [Gammaproteobacteria bacterium]|nr:MotA/TolQ/ExbB proton channel family protein [Gammaproteobacteria bacterium]